MGLLLRVLKRLEKRTEGWPMPALPAEPSAEFWAEVPIGASCQAVWDQIEARPAQTHVTDAQAKVVLLDGPPFEDGEPRSLAFRMTDRGQLSVVTSTVVSVQPPHESVRRMTGPAGEVVEVLERHTLTEVAEGCLYRVAIEWRTHGPVRLSKGFPETVQESLVEFTSRIKYLTDGGLD